MRHHSHLGRQSSFHHALILLNTTLMTTLLAVSHFGGDQFTSEEFIGREHSLRSNLKSGYSLKGFNLFNFLLSPIAGS